MFLTKTEKIQSLLDDIKREDNEMIMKMLQTDRLDGQLPPINDSSARIRLRKSADTFLPLEHLPKLVNADPANLVPKHLHVNLLPTLFQFIKPKQLKLKLILLILEALGLL